MIFDYHCDHCGKRIYNGFKATVFYLKSGHRKDRWAFALVVHDSCVPHGQSWHDSSIALGIFWTDEAKWGATALKLRENRLDIPCPVESEEGIWEEQEDPLGIWGIQPYPFWEAPNWPLWVFLTDPKEDQSLKRAFIYEILEDDRLREEDPLGILRAYRGASEIGMDPRGYPLGTPPDEELRDEFFRKGSKSKASRRAQEFKGGGLSIPYRPGHTGPHEYPEDDALRDEFFREGDRREAVAAQPAKRYHTHPDPPFRPGGDDE